MADNIPNIPSGAVPPKKETGKVQPKKETVRINLPPKPSAAPTIKLPTLPPGGPGSAPQASAPAPSLSTGAHAPAGAPRAAAAPMAAARPAAGAAVAASRSAPAPVASAAVVSVLDVSLAIAAAVFGLAALGSTVYLWQLLGW